MHDARMTDASGRRLSLPRVLAFSTLSIPLAGVGLPVGVYLAPLYANEVGLGLELTGLLFMLLRLWDLVTDPVMGFLVDRYRSPLGRVRHWILISVPILGLATFFIYLPPRDGVTPGYFIIWMLLFYVGFTLLQTSRSAWVPAIARDYDDRSRLFLWAEIVSVLAMLGLLAVPAILAAMQLHVDRFAQVATMGCLLLIFLPLSAFLSTVFVPDPPMKGEANGAAKFDLKSMLAALRNKLLGRVLLVEVLAGTAIAVTAANYLFVAEHVFKMTDAGASMILMLFFLCAAMAMPLWLKLAAKTEKHIAFCAAALTAAISYIYYYIAGQVGTGMFWLLPGAILNGAAFSAPLVLTRSMIADIVEEQTSRTGENRSGIYYSMLTSAYKFGASLALGVGYFILGQVAGFHPGKENSPEAIHGLLLVFCLLPGILYVLAAIAASSYTLTREVQKSLANSMDPRGPELMD
ncbi:hypothetical protein HY29_13170 [Hyphomonas beringensis]|uniref:MFS transporter n=2 Tax=Hyphomonas beringensis TaxID=1280946 RepID=A0A062U3F5_9PROT|nr:hypothetical protein HY29_13170 [Hyphomonas beringensis]